MIRKRLLKEECKRKDCPIQRITFIHHKGGTGKTTSCLNIAGWLTKMNQKVLVVDLDPQANATTGLGVDLKSIEKSMCDVLLQRTQINKIILKTDSDVYLAPATTELLTTEISLAQAINPRTVLHQQLQNIDQFFNFILIDSPPGANLLMVNSIVAAKNIIIPMDTGVFGYEALEILDTIIFNLEHELKISINLLMAIIKGFSPSIFHAMTTRTFRKMISDYFIKKRNNCDIHTIPFSRKIYQSQMRGLPVSHYAARSNVSKSYRQIAEKIMLMNVI